jgi:hypothetical protein
MATAVITTRILHVRCPGPSRRVLQIHMESAMTPELLGGCIHQAISVHVQHDNGADNYNIPEPLVGLFGETNGIFVSFEHLLRIMMQQPQEQQEEQIYGITLPRPIYNIPVIPWWQTKEFVLSASLIVLTTSWYYSHSRNNNSMLAAAALQVVFILAAWSDHAYQFLFDLPLRELYRYGPSLIGFWEGMHITEICARITYHGDRSFWARNMDECHAIFAQKEEAFLRIARPAQYIGLATVVFWIVRHLVHAYAQERERGSVKIDRDMVETYRAVQTIVRQTNRTTGSMAAMAASDAANHTHNNRNARRRR